MCVSDKSRSKRVCGSDVCVFPRPLLYIVSQVSWGILHGRSDQLSLIIVKLLYKKNKMNRAEHQQFTHIHKTENK